MLSEKIKNLLKIYKGHYKLIKEYPFSPCEGTVEYCENSYSYSVKYSKKEFWKKVSEECAREFEKEPVLYKSEDGFLIKADDPISLVFRNVDTGEYYSLGTQADKNDYKLKSLLKAGVFKLFKDRGNAEIYKKECEIC